MTPDGQGILIVHIGGFLAAMACAWFMSVRLRHAALLVVAFMGAGWLLSFLFDGMPEGMLPRFVLSLSVSVVAALAAGHVLGIGFRAVAGIVLACVSGMAAASLAIRYLT